MKYDLKKISNTEIEIEIEVSEEELEAFIDKAVIKLGQNLEVEGFRKGKAPRHIIEEKIKKENILAEAAEMAIEENYQKVVLENKISTVSYPKIEIIKLAHNNPLIFKAKVSVLDKIELPDYKEIASSIKIKIPKTEEKEIDNALLWLQKSRAKLTLKNEPAQKGDFIEIEYKTNQGSDLKDAKTYKDSFILGEGHFINGFEDKLIGAKGNGEKKEFSLILPDDYPVKELSGKEIDFEVEINSVQKVELPEINDDFCKNIGDFKDLEALKKSIREGLDTEKEQIEFQKAKKEIVDKISIASDFEVPESLIQKEKSQMLDDLKKEVSQRFNITFEAYLEKVKKTEQEFLKELEKQAEKRIKDILVLREIGAKENIEVSEQEIRQESDNILKNYSKVSDVEKDVDPEKLKDYTKEMIRNEKVLELLKSFAQKE
ncbi:MAG: trigger factor [Candidatus Pacebacteria bacterium]|nr:trigger factor [Candidatus Paceibacterota bacterium]